MKIVSVDFVSKGIPCFEGQISVASIKEATFDEGEESLLVTNENGDYVRNYVFVLITEDNQVIVLSELKDIANLFSMSDEDSKMLCSYITSGLNGSLPIIIQSYEAEDGTTGYIINNSVDISYKNDHGCLPDESDEFFGNPANARVLSEIQSHNYSQMLLVKIMEAGQRRYNEIHFYNKADEIAAIIKDITFMNDNGKSQHLNMTGVENLLSNVKDKIIIG